eukprot:7028321-Heterocapsa_arctica.AAC.1
MTEIMNKDTEHIFYKETRRIRDRIKDMFSHIKVKSKKVDTEVSSEEEEEQETLTGARMNN